MACDICGKTHVHLSGLDSQYATSDIKDICDECNHVCSDHLWKLRAVGKNIVVVWIKRFMQELKEQKK